MNKSVRYAPEVRERAVRMVLEHQGEHESQWAAIGSIANKIGCTPETLRKWVRRAEETVHFKTSYHWAYAPRKLNSSLNSGEQQWRIVDAHKMNGNPW